MSRKLGALAGMAAVLLFLAAADLVLVTRSATLSRLAREKLEALFGDAFEALDVRASLDGTIVLGDVRIKLGGPAFHPQTAERIEIAMGDLLRGRVRRITADGVRLFLSPALFEELGKGESKKTIRDVFPDPDDLPQIVIRGGTIEGSLPGVFPGGPQMLLLRECTATPVREYRAAVQGIFESPIYGRWSGSGEIDLAGGPTQLRLDAAFLRIEPRMREPFSPRLQSIYDRYMPGGICSLTVDLWREGGKDLDFKVTLQAHDMELNYLNFPYQVEHMAGEIVFYERGFRVKHMTARRGGATIRFDGAAGGYPAESPYKFRLEIDDLPLDEDVRAALRPESRKVWDRFSPTGHVNVKGIAEREAGPDRPAHVPLEVSTSGATILFREYPYELRGVAGDLIIDGDEVTVKRLTSREGTATIDFSGAISNLSGDASVDLTVDFRAVPLDERLKKAQAERVKEVWDLLAPGGALDGRLHLTKEKKGELGYVVTLRPHGNTVQYADLPLPISDLEGEVEVVPGEVRVKHLTGKSRGARLDLRGRFVGETVDLHLDAAGATIDDALISVLPAKARDGLRELKLSGGVAFMAGYRARAGGKKEFTVDLKLSKGVVDIEPRIDEIEGHVALEGFIDEDLLLRGPIAISSASIAGKRLTDVGASLNLKGPKVHLVNIKATAYGGLLAGKSFSVDTKTGEIYCESVTVDRLDLHEFSLDTVGYAKKSLGGKASLSLQNLAGRAADLKTVTGKGRLTIHDGVLWEVPLFVSLFTLNPQDLFKSKQQFDTGAVDFELKDRRFLVDKMSFSSESVSVLGRGTVDFDGNLDLVLKTKTGFFGIDFLPINLVTGLFDELKGAFHGVAVTGTFEKPETSQKFFPGIGK